MSSEAETLLFGSIVVRRGRQIPPKSEEPQRLGRTLHAWFDKITNFHLARVSNGPTEALNNLDQADQTDRLGFCDFENFRMNLQPSGFP